jgi:lysophospholipase L1-like esterase
LAGCGQSSRPSAVASASSASASTGAPKPGPADVVFIGDSYTDGVGATSPATRWSTLVALKEGWTEDNFGVGGTGYVNQGSASVKPSTYAQRVAEVAAKKPAAVIVTGGLNDLSYPPAQVADATYLDTGYLLVGHPEWISSEDAGHPNDAGYAAMATAIEAALAPLAPIRTK